MYLLNYLLGAEQFGVHFLKYGVHVIQLLIDGRDLSQSVRIFPTITMCDFTIRQFSNLQDYTVECSLPINFFSEKFFIFMWFWIVAVLLANVYSLLAWLWSVFSITHINFVRQYIKLAERVRDNKTDGQHISCFAEEYLRHDGIFYLRMLSSNTNDVLVAQVIDCLWNHYKTHHWNSKNYHKPHYNTSADCEQGDNTTRARPKHLTAPSTYRRAASKTPANL